MTKIKICGLTRICDIEAVNAALPDYVGFVFAASRRQINYEQARGLKALLAKEIKSVGVFVGAEQELITSLCQEKIIDLVQLHGDEDEEYIFNLKQKISAPIIKAIRVKDREDISLTTADFSLFDTFHKNVYGGTGESFDWQLLSSYKEPFFLAGGLNLANIQQAISMAKPYGVDISSGVETDSRKDPKKIRELVRLVREMEDNG